MGQVEGLVDLVAASRKANRRGDGVILHQEDTLRRMKVCGGSEQKRIRIIQHAKQAFFAHGYEHANLREIAEAAGVGKITIYRFFNDKAGLFRHVMLESAEYLSQSLTSILDPNADVYETLVAFTLLYTTKLLGPIGKSHKYFEILTLILSASVKNPEISSAYRDIFRLNFYRPLVAYFTVLIEKGEFKDEEPDFLALAFVKIIFLADIAIVEASKIPLAEEAEINARKTVSLFLYGATRGQEN